MKSLPSARENNLSSQCDSEGMEAMEDGLRLLAKIIAAAIRRANEVQIIVTPSPEFDAKPL